MSLLVVCGVVALIAGNVAILYYCPKLHPICWPYHFAKWIWDTPREVWDKVFREESQRSRRAAEASRAASSCRSSPFGFDGSVKDGQWARSRYRDYL